MAAPPDQPAIKDRAWLLAIDTATPQAGVALTDGGRVATMSWPGGRQQTTSVPEAVNILLAKTGIALDDLGAIAVTIGPGSFTGLRVGLSLAKGLALVPERALIGVPTLQAMATPFLGLGLDVLVAIPAGRGRVVWAVTTDGILDDAVNTTFAEFIEAAVGRRAIVAGEFDVAETRQLTERGVRLAPSATVTSRAASLATIGFSRWQRGEVDAADDLQPIYLHGRPNPR